MLDPQKWVKSLFSTGAIGEEDSSSRTFDIPLGQTNRP